MLVPFVFLPLLVSLANACVTNDMYGKSNGAVDLILNLTNLETAQLVQLKQVTVGTNGRIVSLGVRSGAADVASKWTNLSPNTRTTAHGGASVTVTLHSLNKNDAGKYCCNEGVTGCGTNLIVTDSTFTIPQFASVSKSLKLRSAYLKTTKAPVRPYLDVVHIYKKFRGPRRFRISNKPVVHSINPDRQPLLEKGILKGKLNLTCKAESTTKPDNHNLPMIYTWFKNDVYYGTGNILHDNHVDINYEGASIVCVATDDPGCKALLEQLTRFSTIDTVQGGGCSSVLGFSEKFTIHPEYGPYSIKLQPTRDYIKPIVGSDLSVDCTSTCNPPCNITWYKDGDVLNNNKQLDIPALQVDDDGIYMCIVNNIYGNRNVSFNIDLAFPPEQKRRAGDDIIEAAVGEMVTASREIIGYPKPVVEVASIITPSRINPYYTNYTVRAMRNRAHHYRLTLSVHVVTDDYLGKYCVYVKNKKGRTHICHTLAEDISDEEPGNIPVLGLGICLGVVILVFSVIIMVLVIKFHKDKRRLRLSDHGYYYIGDTSDKSSVSV